MIHWICYSNSLTAFLRNNSLLKHFAPILGLYYLAIDVWADDFQIIYQYQEIHKFIFICLIALTIFSSALLIVSSIYAKITKITDDDYGNHLVTLSSRAVNLKLKRFKSSALRITPRSTNVFKMITQPDQQIDTILTSLIVFINNAFGIPEDKICVTIMKLDPNTQKWSYSHKSDNNYHHTKPNVLMEQKCAARVCLDSGEPLFFPDKMKAAKDGKYYISERDKRHKTGSFYCYPSITKTKDCEAKHLISIVTYDRIICSHRNEKQADAIKRILTEICLRLDIELTLSVIKSVQESISSHNESPITSNMGANDVKNQRSAG